MTLDTTIGRWLSEDPEGFRPADANLYRYAGNDPTNLVDPTGLAGEPPDLIERVPNTNGEVEVAVKDSKIDAGDVKGTVRVYTGTTIKVSYKSGKSRTVGDQIWMEFDADQGSSTKDVHWVQFIYSFSRNTLVGQDVYSVGPVDLPSGKTKYVRYGADNVCLDAEDYSKGPFGDSYVYSGFHGDSQVVMFDRPGMDHLRGLRRRRGSRRLPLDSGQDWLPHAVEAH